MPFLQKQRKTEPWFKWAERETYRTGLRHKIFYPEGDYYKGDWSKAYQTGKGVELLPSGLQYEGDWLCNKKHGFGVRSQYDEYEKIFHTVYLGDYKNNQMHGYGCQHYENGTFYEGEFKNNKRHGFGRCWFNDNSYFEGYWVKDKQHGYGMLVQADGNRYEGEWRSGKKNGWGVFYHLNSGQKQTGYWEDELCVTSVMEDIRYRQSALFPTKYPIPKLELDPDSPCVQFLANAEKMFAFNEGCQLHKYCYKISSQKSKKEFTQGVKETSQLIKKETESSFNPKLSKGKSMLKKTKKKLPQNFWCQVGLHSSKTEDISETILKGSRKNLSSI